MTDVDIKGLHTHIQQLGSGQKTIVFVHGIVVDNMSSLYFTLANPIAMEHRAILYDLRGHGRTERPRTGYDVETLVYDLDGVLNHTTPSQPVFLLGHSFGGLLSLAYAMCHPEKVAGLILIDPLLPLAGWGEKIAAIFGITGPARDKKIAETYDSMHGSQETRKRRRLATTANALVEDTSLLDDLRRSRDFTESEIAATQCPVLAIYGENSEIIESATRLGDLVPHSQVEIYRECSHLVLFEAPQKVRSLVLAWLAEQS